MYIEIRKMHAHDLYTLCNRNHYFTNGTNAEYDEMFEYVDRIENVTTADIITIAEMIMANSDDEYTGYVENVAFELARICRSQFERV